MTSFDGELKDATTVWHVAHLLLRTWIESAPTAATAARRSNGVNYDRWAKARDAAARHFNARSSSDPALAGMLTDDDRELVSFLTTSGMDSDLVDAVGFGLGARNGALFVNGWRLDMELDSRWPDITLTEGELFPAHPGPWRFAGQGRSSRQSTTMPLDEHPSIRPHKPKHCVTTICFDLDLELDAILRNLIGISGLHPNGDASEMPFRSPTKSTQFVVELPADQEDRLTTLANQALNLAGPRILIAPELTVDRGIVESLQNLVNEHPDKLLISGSRHTRERGTAENLVAGLLADGDPDLMVHAKLVPFTSELSRSAAVKEGIDVPDPQKLTVWQAGPRRVAMLVCKDALDDTIIELLAHIGANTVLIPAMSPQTQPFDKPIARLIDASQALVAVANGPLRFNGKPSGASLVVGRPTRADPIARTAISSAPRATAFRL